MVYSGYLCLLSSWLVLSFSLGQINFEALLKWHSMRKRQHLRQALVTVALRAHPYN